MSSNVYAVAATVFRRRRASAASTVSRWLSIGEEGNVFLSWLAARQILRAEIVDRRYLTEPSGVTDLESIQIEASVFISRQSACVVVRPYIARATDTLYIFPAAVTVWRARWNVAARHLTSMAA